ncbi:pentapeptide repeat-containing protein (plasmid) [Scandinavium goeteborgense]|nr:pentapeptide repeat-containing protein [Scandinavium goeteborgense]
MYFSSANMRGGILTNCNMQNTVMRYANFRSALLNNTDFSNADLRGADLRGANLTGCNLYRTQLYGCDLREAKLPVNSFMIHHGNDFIFYFNDVSVLVNKDFYTLDDCMEMQTVNAAIKTVLEALTNNNNRVG